VSLEMGWGQRNWMPGTARCRTDAGVDFAIRCPAKPVDIVTPASLRLSPCAACAADTDVAVLFEDPDPPLLLLIVPGAPPGSLGGHPAKSSSSSGLWVVTWRGLAWAAVLGALREALVGEDDATTI
jgi:hypothetical protein